MKKKLFLVTACLLLVVLCLAGCTSYAEQFRKIDEMLQADYSKIDVVVTVSQDLDTLTSKFGIEYGADDTSTVTFEIQRFATISESGALPDSYIDTYQGSATVKGGNVTSVGGDVPQDVNLASVVDPGFKFSEKYFTNVKMKANSFTAKVTKPQGFLGQANLSCKSNTMVVEVRFNDVLDYMRIQYVSTNGVQVMLSYTFTAPQP